MSLIASRPQGKVGERESHTVVCSSSTFKCMTKNILYFIIMVANSLEGLGVGLGFFFHYNIILIMPFCSPETLFTFAREG